MNTKAKKEKCPCCGELKLITIDLGRTKFCGACDYEEPVKLAKGEA